MLIEILDGGSVDDSQRERFFMESGIKNVEIKNGRFEKVQVKVKNNKNLKKGILQDESIESIFRVLIDDFKAVLYIIEKLQL